jgi:transposase
VMRLVVSGVPNKQIASDLGTIRVLGRFRAMLRWRKACGLNSWIESARSSGFAALAQFAKTLRRDLEAVQLAITTRWSNGPVEGHIHRLKLIKRQM